MKRWYRLFGLLLGIAATIAFVFYAVNVLKGQNLSSYVSIYAITGITIAALSYSLIIPMSALAWQRLLKSMGVSRTGTELCVIMAVTQLAKYIPGNVGQHVGRAAMAMGRGISPRPYSISVVCEMVLAVLAAAATGFIGWGLAGMGTDMGQRHGSTVVYFIAILSCGFALAIFFGRHLITRILYRFSSDAHDSEIALPGNDTLVFAFAIYMLNYAVLGVGITIMAMFLLPGQDASWLLLTGSFALAWVIGFFSPGAPGGLGIREALMLSLLQFAYGQTDALLIVIALRLATTAGDLFCFILGYATFLIPGRFQIKNILN